MAGEWAIDQPESFTVGDLTHGHIVLDPTGLHAYATDGVTVIFGVDTATGTVTITASPASVIPGASVSGAVASATNATNVPAAGVTAGTLGAPVVVPGGNVSGAVASSTTATNLAGGGTASGTTTIAGQLIVGNPLAAHVVIGTDTHGADGVRLYGSDGITPLIDLNIAGTPTITGALIRTAASGQRIEIAGATGNRLSFFSGAAGEVASGLLAVNALTASGNPFTQVALIPPQLSTARVPELILNGAASSGFVPASASFRDDLGNTWFNVDQTGASGTLDWDGLSLTAPGFLDLTNGMALSNSGGFGGTLGIRPFGSPNRSAILIAQYPGQAAHLIEIQNSIGVEASWVYASGGFSMPSLDIQGNTGGDRIFFENRGADPASPGAGSGFLYVVNGALKYRGGNGTISTVAAA